MRKFYVRCGRLTLIILARTPKNAAVKLVRRYLIQERKDGWSVDLYVSEHGFSMFNDRGISPWYFRTADIVKRIKRQTP